MPRIAETESGLWRTPAAQEPGVALEKLETRNGEPIGSMCRHYNKETGRLAQIGLTQQVKANFYHTPTAKANQMAPSMSKSLWRTPQAHDAKLGANYNLKTGPRGMLTTQVKEATQVNGPLNPQFVEWLMGYPTGWTDLED
jgi:hypothetical protein